jgi:hypothetical protein
MSYDADYSVEPRLGLWLSQSCQDVTLQKCLNQLGYVSDVTWQREHERLLRDASRRVHAEDVIRHRSLLLGSWLQSSGVNVDFAVTLPQEDAHEEYAFLAASRDLSDVTETLMDADNGLDYAHADLAWVKKPEAVVVSSRTALLCSRKPLSCSSRAPSPTKKQLRDLRQTQRRRRLCSERREKVILALTS